MRVVREGRVTKEERGMGKRKGKEKKSESGPVGWSPIIAN